MNEPDTTPQEETVPVIEEVKTSHSDAVKTFSYSKGGANLSFSLSLNTQILNDFLEILGTAKTDLESELSSLK